MDKTIPGKGVGGELLTARHIFINVGGRAIVPDMPGIREVSYLTNTSLLALERVPEHLVAVGGSYVGLEFAQMYRRFRAGAGSEVRLAIAESYRAVESAAPAALPTTSPFFGRWAMGIAGQTTTYDTSGSDIIRTDSWTGARGGFLEIDPKGTYIWKVYPSDPPSEYLRGRWRAAAAAEARGESGAIVLLAAREGQLDRHPPSVRFARRARDRGPRGSAIPVLHRIALAAKKAGIEGHNERSESKQVARLDEYLTAYRSK